MQCKRKFTLTLETESQQITPKQSVMSKQLLIYERVSPVSKEQHGNYSVQSGSDYSFAKELNAIPLMAVEFPMAVHDYAIVFTGNIENNTLMPAVIVGLEPKNLYVTATGEWNAKYVPAFIRQYPFVFASTNAGQTLTLCIDEEFSGCNQDGQGERLFGDDGEPTAYLQSRLEFLKEYQTQIKRTQLFCQHLNELGLLEPLRANLTLPSGETAALQGFLGISREKVKALTGEQLAQLAASDELELIYLHLQAMRNFGEMRDRLPQPVAA